MAEDRPKSPYPAFATFDNFITELAKKPDMLPPRIDNSVMTGMSGGTQSQLKLALRFFGLVGGEGDEVTAAMRELVRLDPDGRKSKYAEMVATFWPEAMALSANAGTAGQLSELFGNLYGHIGSTRDKAIRFFLQMAEAAGVELSGHFAVPRATPRRKRKKEPAAPATVSPKPASPSPAGGSAPAKTVTLASGGTVTLSYDVDLFEVSDRDQEFVLGLIGKMKKYEAVLALGPGEDNDTEVEDDP